MFINKIKDRYLELNSPTVSGDLGGINAIIQAITLTRGYNWVLTNYEFHFLNVFSLGINIYARNHSVYNSVIAP